MDGSAVALQEKLDQLLREAAEVSVDLDRADGTIVGVPHDSVIEARAHERGRRLSRQVQARQMGTLAAQPAHPAQCPGCGVRCESVRKTRRVRSIDGPLAVEELVAHCPRCRRDFFPPPGDVGL